MVVCSVCLVSNYGGATTADRKLGHRQWQAVAATSFVAASSSSTSRGGAQARKGEASEGARSARCHPMREKER
jgi:hypothetical protein